MKYSALTEKGRREHNEDCLFIPRGGEVPLAVVAAGMGGHRAGSTASAMAVDTLVREIKKGGLARPQEIIAHAVDTTNRAVYEYAGKNRECRGMGTTLVMAMPFRSHYIAASVGDSRLYHYDGAALRQITRDHSYVQELLDAGYITKEQAAVHPRRNVITRAIGTSAKEQADIFTLEWGRGDVLLLCTDGLYSALEDMEMARILREENDMGAACGRLVEEAYYGGSTDNITVALIRNEEEGC